MSEMAAEDLEGGDDEYVRWAGEYKLIQRLQERLLKLQEISYGGAEKPGEEEQWQVSSLGRG